MASCDVLIMDENGEDAEGDEEADNEESLVDDDVDEALQQTEGDLVVPTVN